MKNVIIEIAKIQCRKMNVIDLLLEKMQELMHAGKKRKVFHIPNREAGALNTLYQNATVEDVEYTAEEILVTAVVDAKVNGMLKKYDPEWVEPEEE